jgi:L,D-peptidoglycan transpeptidase YkuD (ErfK/YbiS/YcfS/YnhG family)
MGQSMTALVLQLVLVVTSGWNASSGELSRWENQGGAWQKVGATVPVALGENGLAWGRGLHPARSGRQKREGDRRSPAGRFAIGALYERGRDPANLVCVDDPASKDYNQVVADAPKGEPMTMYRRAILVMHNRPAKNGAGSCIFLHDGDSATVGCTAMAPAALDELAAWLKPGAQLVQLPRPVYQQLKAKWQLP